MCEEEHKEKYQNLRACEVSMREILAEKSRVYKERALESGLEQAPEFYVIHFLSYSQSSAN